MILRVKRLFDVVLALLLVAPTCVVAVLILIAIKLSSPGPALFWSERVGVKNKLFSMPKFRTMRVNTPSVATHLLEDPQQYLTPIGHFLRKSSLDELPQLWNVLRGDMSLVGPRPCLFNQQELIAERNALGVFDVRPGITGLAQINKIDMSTHELLAQIDATMISGMSVRNYFKYIFLTVAGKGSGDRIRR